MRRKEREVTDINKILKILVDNPQEKIHGLNLLMQNQTGQTFEINENMAATVEVIKVVINDFSSKECKRYPDKA